MRPLGAKLFIAKGGRVSHLFEDCAEGGAVVDLGFSFDADFVSACGTVLGWVVACGGAWLALMGDGPEASILPQPKNLLRFAQGAAGRVVEGVLLEGARRIEQETEAGEKRLEACEIVNGKLEFDLGALHSKSIRRRR